MSEKEIKFEDGSLAKFSIKKGALSFYIQARHLGKEIKTTSTTVTLTPEETAEFYKWIGKKLIEESNE
jgi:hypothetical protein